MVHNKQIRHHEVVVMDNASIHTGGEASIVQDFLWTVEVDGRPLKAYALLLPARSPELNPIELVFHIISRDIRNWKNFGNVNGQALKYEISRACNNITFDTVAKCCHHCGY